MKQVPSLYSPEFFKATRNYRAMLSENFMRLLKSLHEKVPAEVFSFALEIGNILYRERYPERDLMAGMVCSAGMTAQEELQPEDRQKARLAWEILEGNKPVLSEANEIKQAALDIASLIGAEFIRARETYSLTLISKENAGEFLNRCRAFMAQVKEGKFYPLLKKRVNDLSYGLGFYDPQKDDEGSIYELKMPAGEAAKAIRSLISLAGFYSCEAQEGTDWQHEAPFMHCFVRSFPWQEDKLLRLMQLIGAHYSQACIKKVGAESRRALDGWHRLTLTVHFKSQIFGRQKALQLLEPDNFSDPWPTLLSLV